MILDKRTEFCDATSLDTTGTGRDLIGSQIDLDVARDIGLGSADLWFVVQVDTAVTSVGSATVSFELASDASAAIATDGTASVHFASAAIAVATLVAGYTAVCTRLPSQGVAYERYLGVLQNTATAALTAGKVNAFLTLDPAKWTALADAIA